VEGVLACAQTTLFDAAQARLGRPALREGRRGRIEREVVAACAEADMLVLARDGDHTRLGPRSLGHATRFVLDHAPCRVLLVWPDEPPVLATLPPPGPPRPPEAHHRVATTHHGLVRRRPVDSPAMLAVVDVVVGEGA
jgi:hypothetical protein